MRKQVETLKDEENTRLTDVLKRLEKEEARYQKGLTKSLAKEVRDAISESDRLLARAEKTEYPYRATEFMKRATEVLSNAVNNQVQELEAAADCFEQWPKLESAINGSSLSGSQRDVLTTNIRTIGAHFVAGELREAVSMFDITQQMFEEATGKKWKP